MIGWLIFFGALGVITWFVLILIWGIGIGLLAYQAWESGKRRPFSYLILLAWPLIKSLRVPVLYSIGLRR
jgi:hypothetical protein